MVLVMSPLKQARVRCTETQEMSYGSCGFFWVSLLSLRPGVSGISHFIDYVKQFLASEVSKVP